MIQYTAMMEGYQSCYIISAFIHRSFISGAAIISSSYTVSTPSSSPQGDDLPFTHPSDATQPS